MCPLAPSITWFAYIAGSVKAVVESSQDVWSPSLSACASSESQQQAGRNQCRFFHFPILPLNSVVITCEGTHFPEQLYDVIPVVQAKNEKFS